MNRAETIHKTKLAVTFPASFQQWEGMQVDPDTGEIVGGVQS